MFRKLNERGGGIGPYEFRTILQCREQGSGNVRRLSAQQSQRRGTQFPFDIRTIPEPLREDRHGCRTQCQKFLVGLVPVR